MNNGLSDLPEDDNQAMKIGVQRNIDTKSVKSQNDKQKIEPLQQKANDKDRIREMKSKLKSRKKKLDELKTNKLMNSKLDEDLKKKSEEPLTMKQWFKGDSIKKDIIPTPKDENKPSNKNVENSKINEDRNKKELPNNDAHSKPIQALKDSSVERIDWHDYEAIRKEKTRTGPGEQGKPVNTSLVPKDVLDKLYSENGYSAALSDAMSLHRSLPDTRPPNCSKMLYRKDLPNVSIIFPFHNEHFSVILRMLWSITDRTPEHLVKELILVDDCSTKEFLKGELEDYLKKNFPKAKIVRQKERKGLTVARIAGAKVATGDVLIILDVHCEVNVNWLPPLLDLIAEDYRTCVCPIVDTINYDTFEYTGEYSGGRGVFDWSFMYKWLDPFKGDDIKDTDPYENPVMLGGLFAISSKFFWELGGYDDGLLIWGGEQYELSFKIWQCGGRMLDVPCSHVGHLYRHFVPFVNPYEKINFMCMNFRRVAEVWMDEYKEYFYMRDPECAKIPFGDISKQLAVREKLKCKPFKWFMEEIVYDLTNRFPLIEPPDIARGEIRNEQYSNQCIQLLDVNFTVGECSPGAWWQQTLWSWRGEIKELRGDRCLDCGFPEGLKMDFCHAAGGNQLWTYDEATKTIRSGYSNSCLDLKENSNKPFLSPCKSVSKSQKWLIQNFNKTQLERVSENLIKRTVTQKKKRRY